MIFQGVRTSFAKKPFVFVIFQGGGGGGGGGSGPPVHPLDRHMHYTSGKVDPDEIQH